MTADTRQVTFQPESSSYQMKRDKPTHTETSKTTHHRDAFRLVKKARLQKFRETALKLAAVEKKTRLSMSHHTV